MVSSSIPLARAQLHGHVVALLCKCRGDQGCEYLFRTLAHSRVVRRKVGANPGGSTLEDVEDRRCQVIAAHWQGLSMIACSRQPARRSASFKPRPAA